MTTPPRRRAAPHRRNQIIAGVAAGALVLGGLAGYLFGGSEDDPGSAATGDVTSTATSAPTSSDATPGGPSATGTPAPDDGSTVDPADDAIITPTELEPFLLRGSDLPPGWRTLESASTATSTLMGSCLRKATTPSVPHVAKATSFRSGSNGPVLTASVRDFTTPSQSARAMTAVRAAVLACVNANGSPALKTFTLTSKADASVAVTFVVSQDGSSARGEVLVARVGARSATVALVGLTEKDLAIGQDALRTMIARLDR